MEGYSMKRYISLVFLCTVSALQARSVTQTDQLLMNLEKTVQERIAELPELKKKLTATAAGSEDARRLRSKINQYKEYIQTAEAELKARKGQPSPVRVPVAPVAPAPVKPVVTQQSVAIPQAPALPAVQPQEVQLDSAQLFENPYEDVMIEDTQIVPVTQPKVEVIEQIKVKQPANAALLKEIRKGKELLPVKEQVAGAVPIIKGSASSLQKQIENAMSQRRIDMREDIGIEKPEDTEEWE